MLKIKSNLIFTLEKNFKKNLWEELLLQGCVLEKRPFFFLLFLSLERTFLLHFSVVIPARGAFFDALKSVANSHKISSKEGREEGLHAWSYGASNSWMLPPPFLPFGLSQEGDGLFSFTEERRGCGIRFGAWKLMVGRGGAWRILNRCV